MVKTSTQTITPSALQPGEDGHHVTYCRICEPLCGLVAEVKDGRIVKVRPDKDNPHSLGHVCIKGTSAHNITHDPDRILTPLRRTGGPGEFEPVSWDEALEDIASRMASILREDGPDAFVHYFGNPSAFNVAAMFSIPSFFAHFGIWKAFSAQSQDINSRFVAWHILHGAAFQSLLPDLPRTDFLIMFGSNPLISHGSFITEPRLRVDMDAIAARGRVVIVDPKLTESAARYEHLPVRPDTDVWLLAAMINHLFAQGRVDEAQLARLATGTAELRAALGWITPALAERYCGVPAEQIEALANDFADSPRAVATGRIGICRGTFPTLTNLLVDVLNIVTGRFGQIGGWVFGDSPLKQEFFNAVAQRETRFGTQPIIAGCLPIFMLIDEILEPGPGRARALFVTAGNIVRSIPGGERLEQALNSLELFVSHDLYITETNRFAHYILPALTFFEHADFPALFLANMPRPYVQYSAAVLPPQGEGRNEDEVLTDLARRLWRKLKDEPGNSGYDAQEPFHCDAFAYLDIQLRNGGWLVDAGTEKVPLSLEVLKASPHGVMLADNLRCTDSMERITHADGYIHLWDPILDAEAERLRTTPPPKDGELRLISIRSLKSHNSWMHNVDKLVRSQEPMLVINPEDAAARNIAEGDVVHVTTSVGAIKTRATLDSGLVRGAVCYPHGWSHNGGWQRANAAPGVNVNVLVGPKERELISASSLLDGIPVEVSRGAAV